MQQPPIVPILGYGAIGQGQNIVALAGQQPQVVNETYTILKKKSFMLYLV